MRKLVLFFLSSLSYLFAPSLAFAQNANASPCASATGITLILCNLSGDVGKTLGQIVFFVVILAIVIALLYLLYGGIKWITSRGEKTEVEAARNHIIAAIVGLIVVFLAIFILSIILSAFNIDIKSLQIPKIGGS